MAGLNPGLRSLWEPTAFARWKGERVAIFRRKKQKPKPQQFTEAPGRKHGQPAGTWVNELADLQKAIILCFGCAHNFDHKRSHYYKDRKFPWVVGRCDGCRVFSPQAHLYIHESLLTDYRGRTRSGQVWTPR